MSSSGSPSKGRIWMPDLAAGGEGRSQAAPYRADTRRIPIPFRRTLIFLRRSSTATPSVLLSLRFLSDVCCAPAVGPSADPAADSGWSENAAGSWSTISTLLIDRPSFETSFTSRPTRVQGARLVVSRGQPICKLLNQSVSKGCGG